MVLTLLAASNPLCGQSDSDSNEARVVLSWEDGGVWVSGHLTEVVSGAPVRQAIVQAGTGGTLTDERAFFFQDMRFEPCEAIFAVGHEPTPNRVALFPRGLETDLPVIGGGSVVVRRYENPDSTVVPVEATDGGLTLPITEAGVYSVVLNLQGYETWSRDVFVVPYDACDERRMSDVDEDVWLLPNRAR